MSELSASEYVDVLSVDAGETSPMKLWEVIHTRSVYITVWGWGMHIWLLRELAVFIQKYLNVFSKRFIPLYARPQAPSLGSSKMSDCLSSAAQI